MVHITCSVIHSNNPQPDTCKSSCLLLHAFRLITIITEYHHPYIMETARTILLSTWLAYKTQYLENTLQLSCINSDLICKAWAVIFFYLCLTKLQENSYSKPITTPTSERQALQCVYETE